MSSRSSLTGTPVDTVTPPWSHADSRHIVHVGGGVGIDEFGSEDLRRARRPVGSWHAPRFLEGWALPVVSLVAIVEAVALLGVGVYLSGLLAAHTGTLIVESQPPGAQVLVDGRQLGTTPARLEVPEGHRSVEVRLNGQNRGMALEIGRGETARARVDIVTPAVPPPREGSARITTDPDGARVTIDGAPAGVTPLSMAGLAPGTHTLTLRGSGLPVSRSFDVQAGETTTFHVELTRPAAGPGWLELSAAPALQVYEDGRFLGSTTTGRLALPAGAHALRFVNDDLGIRVDQPVTIRAGATARITPTLPEGTLAINADPWADVWVNGEQVGQTPMSGLSRTVGVYDVLLRHPTLGEHKTRVKITAGSPVRLNVNLRQVGP